MPNESINLDKEALRRFLRTQEQQNVRQAKPVPKSEPKKKGRKAKEVTETEE